MAEAADYIVVGQCAAYDASWNMARDPENPELESASVYIEGRIYRFEAENVLKGEMEDTFSVCYEATVQVSMEAGDSVLAPDGDYVAPDIGETYLLFLTSDGTYLLRHRHTLRRLSDRRWQRGIAGQHRSADN